MDAASCRGAFCIWQLLSISPALLGLNPAPSITQYGHTAWRLGQDGLEGTPASIVQIQDGYIWIGTNAGLFRFDGIHFTLWNPPAGEHLPSANIFRLLGSRDGRLYIGTDLGLARLRSGICTRIPTT